MMVFDALSRSGFGGQGECKGADSAWMPLSLEEIYTEDRDSASALLHSKLSPQMKM